MVTQFNFTLSNKNGAFDFSQQINSTVLVQKDQITFSIDKIEPKVKFVKSIGRYNIDAISEDSIKERECSIFFEISDADFKNVQEYLNRLVSFLDYRNEPFYIIDTQTGASRQLAILPKNYDVKWGDYQTYNFCKLSLDFLLKYGGWEAIAPNTGIIPILQITSTFSSTVGVTSGLTSPNYPIIRILINSALPAGGSIFVVNDNNQTIIGFENLDNLLLNDTIVIDSQKGETYVNRTSGLITSKIDIINKTTAGSSFIQIDPIPSTTLTVVVSSYTAGTVINMTMTTEIYNLELF